MKNIIKLFLLLIIVGISQSCEYNWVVVEQVDPEVPISFATQVEPIWATQGCTGCHSSGSSHFSLVAGEAYNSLISKELIDLNDAASSLIVVTPGTGIHGNVKYIGNQRETIKIWIEQGAHDN
jgi:hypothetical protein